jgi:hypothetical protein
MTNMTNMLSMLPLHVRYLDTGLDILFVILINIVCISVKGIACYIAYICTICNLKCKIICKGYIMDILDILQYAEYAKYAIQYVAICNLNAMCKLICKKKKSKGYILNILDILDIRYDDT